MEFLLTLAMPPGDPRQGVFLHDGPERWTGTMDREENATCLQILRNQRAKRQRNRAEQTFLNAR